MDKQTIKETKMSIIDEHKMDNFRRLEVDEVRRICKDDPVRPYIDAYWRVDNHLKGMIEYKEGDKTAYICYTVCARIPESEMDMYNLSYKDVNHINSEPSFTTAVFYTVWSTDGIGWKLIKLMPEYIKQQHSHVEKFVTLSPLTPMATNFHMRNGAKCLNIGQTCQNFEYKLDA